MTGEELLEYLKGLPEHRLRATVMYNDQEIVEARISRDLCCIDLEVEETSDE